MLPKCPRETVLTSPRINRRRGEGGLRNARHFHLKSHFNGTFQTQNVNSIRISEGGREFDNWEIRFRCLLQTVGCGAGWCNNVTRRWNFDFETGSAGREGCFYSSCGLST